MSNNNFMILNSDPNHPSSFMKNSFSVIMPTYNQASFIRKAIFSLQQQTCPDWEWWC